MPVDLPSTFGARFQTSTKDALQQFGKDPSIRELAYKTYVVCQERAILVEAWLPETVGMDVNASYEAPYAQGLGGINIAGADIGQMARFLGLSLTTQALTAQVWQGGAFIEFTLPLIFQTENSAAVDVMGPIKELLRLTMPRDPSGGGLLEAPGPRIDLDALLENSTNAVGQAFSNLTNVSLSAMTGDAGSNLLNSVASIGKNVAKKANDTAKTLSKAIVNSVKNNISLHIGQFLYFPSVVITDVSPTYDVVITQDKNPIRATVNVAFRTFYLPTDRDINIMFPSTAGVSDQNYSNEGRRGY